MLHTLGGYKGRADGGLNGGSQVRRGREISFPDPTAGDSTWSASLLILGAGASQKVCGGRGCLLLRVTVITGRLQLCGRTHLHPSLRAAVAFKIIVRHFYK